MSGKTGWLIRLAVSAAVLAVLAAVVPLRDLWSAVQAVPVWLAAGVLVGFLLGHVVAAIKWWCLMAPHADVDFRLALRAHFAGLTANLCLPGITGGDVVRAAMVMRHATGRTGIGVASIADRLLDCLALLVLAAAGVLMAAEPSGALGTALTIGAGVVFGPPLAVGLAYPLLRRFGRGKLAGRLAEALGVLAAHPAVLVRSFLMSLAVQASFVAFNAWLGRAAGVETSFRAWLIAWPLAKLIALAPLSLNGLGVREAALVFFMRPFGATPAAVTAVGLYWQAVLAAGGIIGSLAVATPGKTTEEVAQPAGVA